MDWRLIVEDGAGAAEGLAADEALAASVGRGLAPPALRLYTYRPHAALAGRFQTVETEIDVEACAREGVGIGRRPTGGGAILMGPDQLGVALAVPARGEDRAGRPRELMERFSRGVVDGLAALGIAAGFRGKNDLEVQGRKIAGLGLHRDASGGLLFHASVLVDLDVALMTRVLRVPFEKVAAHEIAVVADRTTTVRKEAGRAVPMGEARDRIAAGFAKAFDVTLAAGAFTGDERAAAAELVSTKHGTREWVFAPAALSEAAGTARARTPLGTIEVHAALAGPTLKAVWIRGDFLAPAEAVADLEASLRWHPSRPESVADTVVRSLARAGAGGAGLPGEVLAAAVLAAIEDARRRLPADGDATVLRPYGCFVDPEAARA